jgi:hypothetical protein
LEQAISKKQVGLRAGNLCHNELGQQYVSTANRPE